MTRVMTHRVAKVLRLCGQLLCALLLVTSSVYPAYAATDSEAATPEVTSSEKSTQSETSYKDVSLDTVYKAVQADLEKSKARMKAREAEFAKRRDESKQRLARSVAKMQALEKRGRELEGTFEHNRVELNTKAKLLKDKLGALKELFGVFQQNASDLIGSFNNSPTSLQFPNRDEWLEGFANRMRVASEVSSVDDIMGLWFEMQREITSSGDIVSLRAPVVTVEGKSTERDVVRIGNFGLITKEPQPSYLLWSDAGQEIVALDRQPASEYLAQIDGYLSAKDGLHTVSVDPTGGTLVSLLVQKPTLIERIHQGGLVGYIILALGAWALLLAAFKLIDISQINMRVQVQQRAMNSPNTNNVLGQLLTVYKDNYQLNTETLEMRLHEAVAKASIRVNRFTVFLGIIAAVAPLLGLLGTVVGMINTFQAITLYGTGDPQTMAGGISQALITTVLGLVVAVPAVLLHSVISGRCKRIVNMLQRHSAALTGDQMQAQSVSSPPANKSSGSGPDLAPVPA